MPLVPPARAACHADATAVGAISTQALCPVRDAGRESRGGTPMTDLSNILGRLGGGNLDSILSSFNQGNHDQVSDTDVHETYGQVTAQLPQDQYVQAARDAFEKLTPGQREQLARELQNRAPQQGVTTPATQSVSADPGSLANAVGDVHAQQPNLLQQMFAPGGTFSSPVAKAALLGITAMAAQRLMGSGR